MQSMIFGLRSKLAFTRHAPRIMAKNPKTPKKPAIL